jgi:8-oxo-dGTP diphosphatase
MSEEFPVARSAVGAACVVLDADGRVLLVHHTYGHLNWELPGGLGEADESPAESAARELREETGLIAAELTLVGIYYEPSHRLVGPLLHHLFRCLTVGDAAPIAADPGEVSEVGWWSVDSLPAPMSDFTERRIRDALAGGPIVVDRVEGRRWRS